VRGGNGKGDCGCVAGGAEVTRSKRPRATHTAIRTATHTATHTAAHTATRVRRNNPSSVQV